MEVLHYKEELNFTMVDTMRKISDNLGKRSFVPAFLVIVFAFFATPAWSEPPGRHGSEGLHRGSGYGDHKVLQRRVAQNDRGKKRKNYKSLTPEEKSKLNGKIRKWKSLPPEEQALIPGLNDSIRLFSLGLCIEYDSRNREGNPSAGWDFTADGRMYRQVGGDSYSFIKAGQGNSFIFYSLF